MTDLLNWQSLTIELIIGGVLAFFFFYIEHKHSKEKDEIAKRRREIASQEIVSAFSRLWWTAQNIEVNCKINNLNDELDKGFPTEGMLALLIDKHKHNFYSYMQHIRTLVVSSADVLEPPELTQKILSFCNGLEERISDKPLYFHRRWSVAIEDIEKFVKENFPSLYNKISFDQTLFQTMIENNKK